MLHAGKRKAVFLNLRKNSLLAERIDAARLYHNLAASLAYLPALVPVALLTLKIKYSLMSLQAARVLPRSLGRLENDSLAFWEKLSLFSHDMLVSFLVFPVCCLALLMLLQRRGRMLFTAGLNVLLFFMLFATWQCYLQTGRYYSSSTFLDSVSWVWLNPSFIGAYVSGRSGIQIGAAVVFILAVSVWAGFREKKSGRTPRWPAVKYGAACYTLIILVAASAPPALSTVSATSYHTSVMTAATGAFWEIGGRALPLSEYAGLDTDALIRRYREKVRAPEPEATGLFRGKAAGYNVLFFILETAPARILRLNDDLRHLPAMARLKVSSFVAHDHHSTYPYTNRAWFSIFSSLYPSSLLQNYSEKPGAAFPGIMRSLSGEGYRTKIYYMPFLNDPVLFRSLGVAEQYMISPPRTAAGIDGTTRKLAEDSAAVETAKRDIERWLQEGRKFCIALGPQIGHAPWPEIPGMRNSDDVRSRAEALIEQQDRWLGELIGLLEHNGALQKTIIVVTSDHGVRTRQEDPEFEGGQIDEYSFHVPLLIYAPGILHAPRAVPWVTSHIDITPTVLDLLGAAGDRSWEQGSPVWDPRLKNRTTYFFAHHYFGADGYFRQGWYYMKNHITDNIYKNNRLQFPVDTMIPAGSKEHAEITKEISGMVALQQLIGEKAGGGARTPLPAASYGDRHGN